MNGIRGNGISVSVQKWRSHKKPVLCVTDDKENCIYKVASFNSEETAQWFLDKMRELFGEEGEHDS